MSLTPTPPRHNRAYALSGATLDALVRALITRIVGGRGIRTRQAGGQVIIEADPRGGGSTFNIGGGGGGVELFANYAAMASATRDIGSLGLTEDLYNLYVRDAAGWRAVHPFVGSGTDPKTIGARDGDHWYNSGVDYVLSGGSWLSVSHLE